MLVALAGADAAHAGTFEHHFGANAAVPDTSANVPPVATDLSLTTPEDTPRAIVLAGTDVDGDTVVATPTSGPAHGAFLAGVYTPNLDFNGTDSFTFQVTDGHGGSDSGTVTISVTPVNDRPEWESAPSLLTIQADSTLTVDVIGRDVDGSDMEFFINFTIAGACTNPAVPGGPAFHDDTGLSPFDGVVLDAGVPRREGATLTIHTKPGAAAGTYCLRLMVSEVGGSGVVRIVSIVIPDTSPPTCVIVGQGKTAAGNAFIRFRVNDVGLGLASHKVTYRRNAAVTVDAYLPGSLGPVYVQATAVDKRKSLGVQVDFLDLAGNIAICDPIVLSVVREDDKLQDETFYNVPQAESRVSIYNGDPGMKKVVIIVNGTKFKEVDLKANEVRKFNIASAMNRGYTNTITVRVRGKKGASALIVIADIP